MELWGQKPAARAVEMGVGDEMERAERRDGEIVEEKRVWIKKGMV